MTSCPDNIENATFPYKIALSETNVRTNRIRNTIWTSHKEQSFVSSYFVFFCFFVFVYFVANFLSV